MENTCPGPHIQFDDFEPGQRMLDLFAGYVVEITTKDDPTPRPVWLKGAAPHPDDGYLCALVQSYSGSDDALPTTPLSLVRWDDLTLLSII